MVWHHRVVKMAGGSRGWNITQTFLVNIPRFLIRFSSGIDCPDCEVGSAKHCVRSHQTVLKAQNQYKCDAACVYPAGLPNTFQQCIQHTIFHDQNSQDCNHCCRKPLLSILQWHCPTPASLWSFTQDNRGKKSMEGNVQWCDVTSTVLITTLTTMSMMCNRLNHLPEIDRASGHI